MIDGKLHGRVTPERFDALIAQGSTQVMTTTVYVPKDASALSLGADEVAHAIAAEAKRRGLTVQLVRNGSRGAFWLEPLVEVAERPRARWPTAR